MVWISSVPKGPCAKGLVTILWHFFWGGGGALGVGPSGKKLSIGIMLLKGILELRSLPLFLLPGHYTPCSALPQTQSNRVN